MRTRAVIWLLPIVALSAGCSREFGTPLVLQDAGDFAIPAQAPSEPPPPGDAWWAEAVRHDAADLIAHRHDDYPPPCTMVRSFEEEPLTAALRALIGAKAQEPAGGAQLPDRYLAAFMLTWLDIDYEHGRDVMLSFLEGSELMVSEEHPAPLFMLYRHRPDPVVLDALVALAPHADGAMTSALIDEFGRLAVSDRRALLEALRRATPGAREAACRLAARGLGQCRSGEDAAWTFRMVAQDRSSPLHEVAGELVAAIDEGTSPTSEE